ncbi:lanthionine synthetase LanC family protein [Chryseobacterium sp.]|uniref:lanthionine synthetase LanC family protein n=1 Tax=Chryseobacterium sp. TaxID=1871047 RepID=UPI0025B95B78|nr:lanthionine synthetase LanC family protein [Chryseobacterium sp.]MBV8326780.1 hypothetical protein [Chryseobacterium sp.]
MSNQKLITLLERINEILLPLEHEPDFNKDRYALLAGDSLFSGNLGLVVYHYNFYKIFGSENSRDLAMKLLQNIIERVEDGTGTLSNYTLSYGLSGLGMVLSLLINGNFINTDDVELGNLDELVFEWAIDRIRNNDSEFMHGAFGAVHYLCENSETGSFGKEYFDILIQELKAKAIHDPDGGIYFDLFNQFIPEYPRNSINLSFSHGITGILFILLDLIDKGLIDEKYKDFALEIVKYLESKIEDVDFSKKIYCHSDSVVSEIITGRRNTRLAWCYGDLNQVVTLLHAGQTLKDESLIALSNKIGITTTKRLDFEQTYISDTQFCHGTSGLVYIYDYLYEKTHLAEYLTAKNHWLEKTLDLLESELNTDYYTQKDKAGELLEGLPGVALVLLSEVGKSQGQKLNWGKIFLLY